MGKKQKVSYENVNLEMLRLPKYLLLHKLSVQKLYLLRWKWVKSGIASHGTFKCEMVYRNVGSEYVHWYKNLIPSFLASLGTELSVCLSVYLSILFSHRHLKYNTLLY